MRDTTADPSFDLLPIHHVQLAMPAGGEVACRTFWGGGLGMRETDKPPALAVRGGLVVAMFDHRDSRTGDPNLHTHAAVSTKVAGRDGRWRSLDGRVLFALGVAASETYNTAVEDELRSRVGVTFTDRARGQARTGPGRYADAGTDRWPRPAGGPGDRRDRPAAAGPVRVPPRRGRGRLPGPAGCLPGRVGPRTSRPVQMKLAQEATLATRTPKGSPRSLELLRAGWVAQARDVLGAGSDLEVRDTVHRAHPHPPRRRPGGGGRRGRRPPGPGHGAGPPRDLDVARQAITGAGINEASLLVLDTVAPPGPALTGQDSPALSTLRRADQEASSERSHRGPHVAIRVPEESPHLEESDPGDEKRDRLATAVLRTLGLGESSPQMIRTTRAE